jgi:hypothetical protein
MDVPSKSRVDKAGDRLKRFVRDGGSLAEVNADHDLRGHIEIIQSWRAQFGGALAGAAMGLRSMIRTCDIEADVSQRHKRVPRIVQKLARPRSTRLSAMQDIAGVRAVVPDLEALSRLRRHIESTWSADRSDTSGAIDPGRTADYIARPRSSGYRAVHLIVKYNGLPVEVQLRTANQHFWADLSERVSRDVDVELKAGEGPGAIADFFVDLGNRVGALDDGNREPWRLLLDLRPWRGDLLTVSHDA